MLNNTGFDLWADGYDKSVGLSDENDRYPFAGYRAMMNALYQRVLAQSGHNVLDIGFGTGILTSRLYEQGCRIYGQDFSARMIELAQAKMPWSKNMSPCTNPRRSSAVHGAMPSAAVTSASTVSSRGSSLFWPRSCRTPLL